MAGTAIKIRKSKINKQKQGSPVASVRPGDGVVRSAARTAGQQGCSP
jgi:hypothetical protein